MKYRSRTDICSHILEAANGGATKTKVMYKAYLSHNQLKEYLGFLIESGLIEQEKGTRLFKVSEKGVAYLGTYSQLSDITGPMILLKA